MTSSYSTDLKLELMVTGENAGTWGDKTNTNLNLIQQAVAGFEAVTITDSATTALVMSDAALSNARNMIIKIDTITLTGATTVTIPDGIEKFYIIDLTAVTGVTNLTIKTASGTGFTAGEAAIVAAYSDGTNLNEIALNTLGGTIAQAQIDDAAISTAKLSDNAVTTAKISNANVTTAKIADNAITSDKISALQVTQAKIANDAVGPDQLSDTAVTPGEYEVATITVDQQGRITAASAGSAGGGFAMKVYSRSPGTYTSPANASSGRFYAVGGGGGGRGVNPTGPTPGGDGGTGEFLVSLAASTGYPYTIGTGGAGGNPGGPPGQPGNATTVPSLSVTANGGEGGQQFSGQTQNGTAPGATVDTGGAGVYTNIVGAGGDGRGQPPVMASVGEGGQPGLLIVFDNG